MEATITVHPFNQAFGPGHLSLFALIDLASLEFWDREPALAERLERSAREYARLMHVELGHCGCCHRPTDEHVLGEVGEDPRTAKRFVVCRRCVDRHCGIMLKRKVAHLEKVRTGYVRQMEQKPEPRKIEHPEQKGSSS